MAGARGDALDWALALARAPAERSVLRQRPLPVGIDDLLQIAAGNRGEALSSAVFRSGESEQDLVEAVRFYLREVLFHSNADAYRVLGLERGASSEEIKGHHRWLQQWLHPDRHTSDWDAIFAGRVNAAWNQLRNQERRQAYDDEYPVERLVQTIPLSPVLAGWARPASPPDSPRERWQRRWPLMALLVACVALGVTALRDLARDQAQLAAGVTDSLEPARDDPSQRGDAILDPLGNLHIPERVASANGKTEAASQAGPRRPLALDRRAPVEQAAETPTPVNRAVVRAPAATAATAAPARTVPTQSSSGTPPTVAAARPRPVAGSPTAGTRASPVAASPPQAPQSIRASPPPAPVAPSDAATAPTVAPTKAPVSAERVRQAQQVGDRLVAYMGKRGTAIPPIWDSPAAQRGAAQLRDAMLADGRPEIAQANWRVGESEARMRVAISHADGRKGHLDAALVWREERWLVRRLSMERDW